MTICHEVQLSCGSVYTSSFKIYTVWGYFGTMENLHESLKPTQFYNLASWSLSEALGIHSCLPSGRVLGRSGDLLPGGYSYRWQDIPNLQTIFFSKQVICQSRDNNYWPDKKLVCSDSFVLHGLSLLKSACYLKVINMEIFSCFKEWT